MFLAELDWDISNPYIHLLIGKSANETKNKEMSLEHLLRAYMLEGEDIFSEDKEYIEYLKESVDI